MHLPSSSATGTISADGQDDGQKSEYKSSKDWLVIHHIHSFESYYENQCQDTIDTCTSIQSLFPEDTVAERLRRSTRNRLGLSRVGSSPAGVVFLSQIRIRFLPVCSDLC